MDKICLAIIFNHKYEKNIPRLRTLYGSRFSNIIFIMPFYTGNDPDVIPVYECSYSFQGYIAQAYKTLENLNCDYFVFIGDDLILAPELNENNIVDKFELSKNSCFIESAEPINKTTYWPYSRIQQIIEAFNNRGTTYKGEIPDSDEAFKIAAEKGFDDFSMRGFTFKGGNSKRRIKSKIKKIWYRYDLPYPIFSGYSDFLIISRKYMKTFAHYSGVFAAMHLWVEMAIPTTLILLCEKEDIVTNKDIQYNALCMWARTEPLEYVENNCDYSLSKLQEMWPDKVAYIHPIKLSKWKD